MTTVKPGQNAIWNTAHGLCVPVRVIAYSGPRNRDAQVIVLANTFDATAGYRAGERIYPVRRDQIASA